MHEERRPISFAQSLLHTATDEMSPDTINHKFQERIRHLLHAATTTKLENKKNRANTVYDVIPKSYHRLLKIISGLLPN
jgi:uncharacterized protein (DUF111 family)